MTIEIKAPVTKEKVQNAIDQLAKTSHKKTLKQHFGKLKRGIKGLNIKERCEVNKFSKNYKKLFLPTRDHHMRTQ